MTGRAELPAVLRRAGADDRPLMQQVAAGEPKITFWTKLETGDDVGWDA